MVTNDSRFFFRQQQPCSNAQSGCLCAEAGATTSQTTEHPRFAWREMRRQEAGFDEEEGGRLSVDGLGKDGLNAP